MSVGLDIDAVNAVVICADVEQVHALDTEELIGPRTPRPYRRGHRGHTRTVRHRQVFRSAAWSPLIVKALTPSQPPDTPSVTDDSTMLNSEASRYDPSVT